MTAPARIPSLLVSVALLSCACTRAVPEPAGAQRVAIRAYAGPNGHSLVVIPGGDFVMGSPSTEAGRSVAETQHRVRIPRVYAIATTEVTNAQFARFLAAVPDYAARWQRATAVRFGTPSRLTHFSRTPDSPQVGVSWYDAARYCNWLSELSGLPKREWVYPDSIDSERGLDLPPDYLHRTGYRLPTEAEWEYAARGGRDGLRFPWGSGSPAYDDKDAAGAVFEGDAGRAVGSFMPNAFGLHHMSGNVWEWVADWFGGYEPEAVTDPRGPAEGEFRFVRGGSYGDDERNLRLSNRNPNRPGNTNVNVGFRCARDLAP